MADARKQGKLLTGVFTQREVERFRNSCLDLEKGSPDSLVESNISEAIGQGKQIGKPIVDLDIQEWTSRGTGCPELGEIRAEIDRKWNETANRKYHFWIQRLISECAFIIRN